MPFFNIRTLILCFAKFNKNKLFLYGNYIYNIRKPNIFNRITSSQPLSNLTIRNYSNINNNNKNNSKMSKESKEELRKRLTIMQYEVTQNAGTEGPHSGVYNKHFEKGLYQCIVCHQDLFSSDNKFDSSCGWPAFNDVLDDGKVILRKDFTLGMERIEVRCANCNAHMGHVFDDGPKPKRKRFCINSAALDFVSVAPK